MAEETAEETPSSLFPATNATSCQECGLSESRRSRSVVMLADCIAVRYEKEIKSHFRVSDGIVRVRKGEERILRLIRELVFVVRTSNTIQYRVSCSR